MQLSAPAHRERSPSFTQRCARALLTLIGWQTSFAPLPAAKGLIVVYPHTSNWDFVIGVLYKFSIALEVRWIGKHTLFRWPLRRLFIRLGGIPIVRNQRSGMVNSVLAEFARCERMWLAVTPEGTRSRTTAWKSGFYRIALAGNMPVGLGYIDYAARRIGIDTYLTLTGDESADFALIREFYKDKRGRHPENAGEIRLQH
jgi:1-acyl-sn-glycerol-3-phosphate acyltransferase